ncbi:OsmC family peroxiredoxin [Nitrincola tibetensis]|uniref:OsmC family peroxiredoxin n=1 Tax=Nitrincola tibetensis TaxID=2219697 RepID=A0A364NNL7_9GAMM|nr:OsmC family protein [Nitrincola tibetensis]RAU18634.1 OsmC family peroxiredoxin [Nitrincola tibetensis]
MSQTKTINVEASLDQGFTVRGAIGEHQLVIDQPISAKGAGLGATPLEMFLFSLAGCIGTIGRIAAFQKKINLKGMNITVEGDYNPAGLLGKPTDDRMGFQEIRIRAVIDADMSDAEKEAFLDEICHRCPLHDNTRLETQVVHSIA